MKPAFLIRIFPFVGLLSCTAPKAITVESGNAVKPAIIQENPPMPKPVYKGSRFGFGVGYGAAFPEPQNAPTEAPEPKLAATPAPTLAAPAPATAIPDADAPPAAPRKSWFSFLKKKDPPKALVVEQPRPPVKSAPKPSPAGDLPGNPNGDLADDGLRLPDMLTMPEKGEFQSTTPAPKSGGGTGAVTVRPPTDPPSRPKPKDKSAGPK